MQRVVSTPEYQVGYAACVIFAGRHFAGYHLQANTL